MSCNVFRIFNSWLLKTEKLHIHKRTWSKAKGTNEPTLCNGAKLITSFGIKHELFNIGFNFQRIKKNGFVIIWFYCLIKFYMIRFPFFTRFLLKVVFFLSVSVFQGSKIPVQTPSLCRATLLGRSDRVDRSVY